MRHQITRKRLKWTINSCTLPSFSRRVSYSSSLITFLVLFISLKNQCNDVAVALWSANTAVCESKAPAETLKLNDRPQSHRICIAASFKGRYAENIFMHVLLIVLMGLTGLACSLVPFFSQPLAVDVC